MSDVTFVAFRPSERIAIRDDRPSKLNVSIEAERRATEMLDSHPHFRGRQRWVQCRCSKRRLYLTGMVPSYYLKQLAQEAVRNIENVDSVINQIAVATPVLK